LPLALAGGQKARYFPASFSWAFPWGKEKPGSSRLLLICRIRHRLKSVAKLKIAG
jgi:hypothetical protein